MDWLARRTQVRELVDEHYVPLYRYAYRLTASTADAEDLTQDAFCRAQMQLHQLRNPQRVRPWLFAILRNNYLRRNRDGQGKKEVALGKTGDQLVAPESEPANDSGELQNALNQLPEAYRTPLILYYFEDFTYRDIADQMDIPIGTVMSRLARAKAFLRQRLTLDSAKGLPT